MGGDDRKVIGIIVAAHQDLGPALLQAAQGIVGVMERAEALSLSYEEDPETARARFAEVLDRVGKGGEVLILTDMFGGTPTNMSLPFLEEGKIEVVTGINLPMLLKAQTARRELGLKELAAFLREYGARNIIVAGEVLTAKSRGAG
jgi:PTS system mannose-specific IIA component